MYGSQPPPHYPPAGYHQSPGPAQPEWRPSRSQQGQQSAPLPPPPPPPPSTSTTYNPNVYGPMPSAQSPVYSNLDTSAWGVRYNQHHGHPTPPPLPPRAGSSTGHQYPPQPSHFPAVTSEGPSTPSWTMPQTGNLLSPTSSTDLNPSWRTDLGYRQTQTPIQSPPVPPPPPIPPAYRDELHQSSQAWQQAYPSQYSNHPLTHHYDPSMQQQAPHPAPALYSSGHSLDHATEPNQTASLAERLPPPSFHQEQLSSGLNAGMTSHGISQETASLPVETVSPPLALTASALGGGQPSDWEHLSSAHGELDDTNFFPPKTADIQQQASTTELPSLSAPVRPSSGVPQPSLGTASSTPQQTPRSQLSQHQELARPPQPPRGDSLQSDQSVVSAEDYSEAIDGVIQAWNQPISPEVKPQNEVVQQSPISLMELPTSATVTQSETLSKPDRVVINPQNASPSEKESQFHPEHRPTQLISDNAETVTPKQEKNVPPLKAIDQYKDLDPWFKSSLARYATMLRKEAVAESDKKRYQIFTRFMAKETKLREVLYNIEPPNKDDTQHSAASGTIEMSPRRKSVSDSAVIDSGLILVESEDQSHEYFPEIARTETASSQIPDDSEGVAYSPGGRPILSSQKVTESLAKQQGLQRSASNPAGRSQSANSTSSREQPASFSRGLSFPSSGVILRTSRSTSVPPSTSRLLGPPPMPPLISEPPQPAYTPFRYSEGPQRGSGNLVIDQPAYQAYSALRQASAESGRAMSFTSAPQARPRAATLGTSPVRGGNDEIFLGVIRQKSVSYRGKQPEVGSSGAIEGLGTLIPDPFPEKVDSPVVVAIETELEKFSDDFAYVYETVDSWEKNAKDRRFKLDEERTSRQEESESHIDALFNDKQIGYADINPLEEESRQTEARKQLDEERKEFENFVRKAFNPLDTRLKEEIVELKALYHRAINELGSQSRPSANDGARYQVSRTMKTVKDVATKLEARFQKRLDIALDRERRRKKAERRPLVFLGDSRALKKLDGDFDRMEKRNNVEAAKDRDERANKLTDSFDDAIMYGLGHHQRLIDDIAAKAKKLDTKMIDRSGFPVMDIELVLRSISALAEFLREDSESMLHSFGAADAVLNDSDYSVSVAEARYSNSGADVFLQLEEEKEEEDIKIQRDLDSKLNSVKKTPSEIVEKIDSLLTSMGKAPGPGPGPWKRPASIAVSTGTKVVSDPASEQHPGELLLPGQPPPGAVSNEDSEQKERLRKALEEAKRRNAAKNYTS